MDIIEVCQLDSYWLSKILFIVSVLCSFVLSTMPSRSIRQIGKKVEPLKNRPKHILGVNEGYKGEAEL